MISAALPGNLQEETTMRMSRLLFATLRETPAEAEIVSHQLMLRAV